MKIIEESGCPEINDIVEFHRFPVSPNFIVSSVQDDIRFLLILLYNTFRVTLKGLYSIIEL